jgi:hypothetical protein
VSEILQETLESSAAASLIVPSGMEQAEPAEEQPAEQIEADAQGVEQEQVEETPEQFQPEEQPEEQDSTHPHIPAEQARRSKGEDFPEDIYLSYAQKYKFDTDALANPSIRNLLQDKINGDIALRARQLEGQSNGHANGNGHAPQAPQFDRDAYFAELDQQIHARTDPRIASAFLGDFFRSLGVPEQEIAGNFTPQQAMTFAMSTSRYVVNLVSTFMPDLIKAALPTAFPGFSDLYERSYHQSAWDRVRNSDAKYANLPGYGSKEFGDALRLASERIPNFDDLLFKGPDGQPLPEMENAGRKYSMLAQLLTSGADPKLLSAAAAAGARNARRAEVRRSAGNLGSGQSSSSMPAKTGRFQSNNDIFDDEAMEMHEREHGRL